MKRLRYFVPGLILSLLLSSTAFAAEVPDNLVVENLNGQQRMVKTIRCCSLRKGNHRFCW